MEEGAVVGTGEAAAAPGRLIGKIPVRNLWLLMMYAADLAQWRGRFMGTLESNLDDLEDVADLIARLLAGTVERRMRRNLTRSYTCREATLHRVRGRIDVLETESRQLLRRGQIHCRFQTLTVDTPRNRLVRAALDRIAGIVERADLAHRCRGLANKLGYAGVGGLPPSRAELAADQMSRNDDDDRSMAALARLAFDLALLTEEAGATAMFYPDRNERWVRKLFEKGILGFARWEFEHLGWEVSGGGKLGWPITNGSPGIDAVLPGMKLDILLTSPDKQRLVIDTKFTGILKQGQHKQERLSSGYLYQLYAYLRTQEDRDAIWKTATGLLLHPAVGVSLREAVTIQGHRLHFATVDLTETPRQITAALRDILTASCHPQDSPSPNNRAAACSKPAASPLAAALRKASDG